jgi:hypothetical protein
MKKGIDIEGELTEVGSVAHRLNVQAAMKGMDLKNYIQLVLKEKSGKKG